MKYAIPLFWLVFFAIVWPLSCAKIPETIQEKQERQERFTKNLNTVVVTSKYDQSEVVIENVSSVFIHYAKGFGKGSDHSIIEITVDTDPRMGVGVKEYEFSGEAYYYRMIPNE